MGTTTHDTPSLSEWRPASSSELLSRGVHRITLPSGAHVSVRFPALGVLIRAGAVPLELREMAAAELSRPGGAAGKVGAEIANRDATDPGEWEALAAEIEKLRRFLVWMVAEHTLVEPRVSVADIESDTMDERDVEMLIDIATRRIAEDARGVRLGVMSLEDMAVFREEHRCAGGCADCTRAQDRLSSPRVVPV